MLYIRITSTLPWSSPALVRARGPVRRIVSNWLGRRTASKENSPELMSNRFNLKAQRTTSTIPFVLTNLMWKRMLEVSKVSASLVGFLARPKHFSGWDLLDSPLPKKTGDTALLRRKSPETWSTFKPKPRIYIFSLLGKDVRWSRSAFLGASPSSSPARKESQTTENRPNQPSQAKPSQPTRP